MESNSSHCSIDVTIIETLVAVVNCSRDLSTHFCTFFKATNSSRSTKCYRSLCSQLVAVCKNF